MENTAEGVNVILSLLRCSVNAVECSLELVQLEKYTRKSSELRKNFLLGYDLLYGDFMFVPAALNVNGSFKNFIVYLS